MREHVYVVTSGSYSDYMIDAVFSTEIAALNYCALGGTYSDRKVETYPLDEQVSAPEGRVYEYSAILYDRSARHYNPYTELSQQEPTAYTRSEAPRCRTELKAGPTSDGDIIHKLRVYGTDYERVRKVYGEKLSELKARIEGVA